MKRFKRLSLKALNLILCLCIGWSAANLGSVFAAAPSNQVDFFSGNTVNIKQTAYYGDDITLPDHNGLTVKSPSGDTVNLTTSGTNKTFEANQLGFYEATYTVTSGAITNNYTYRILVKAKEEWVIEVADNGADIPTVYKLGDAKELPTAKAVVYDEDKPEEVIATSEDVFVSVVDPTGTTVVSTQKANSRHSLNFSEQGTYFVRYLFEIPGSDVKNHVLTKDFTVRVQKEFKDEEGPTLSYSNPSKTANVNVAYTIPKATATDNFDENVKITVKVTDANDNPVKMVEVDEEYDYAIKLLDEEVVFDNNKTMKFYPTEVNTTYKITYSAIDDAGNPSPTYPVFVDVEDNLAPVIELDESAIPKVWGLNVFTQNPNNVNDLNGVAYPSKITFPFPTVRDNFQTQENGVLVPVETVEFTIKDKSGAAVISFSNLSTEAGRKANLATASGNKELTFDPVAGLEFDFNEYHKDGSKVEEYTVTYTARDANRKYSTKDYVINLQEKFVDIKSPEVEILEYPNFVVCDPTEYTTFVVPTPTIVDEKSENRTNVVISLVSGAISKVVEAGDIIRFKPDLEINDKDANWDISALQAIKIRVVATDHVGNSATWESEEITVASTTFANTFTITANVNTDIIKANHTESAAVQGMPVVVADDITIGFQNGDDLVGFEVRITEPDTNRVVSNSSMTVYFGADETPATKTITIKNVTFTPARFGQYTVTVRAFDFAGNEKIMFYNVAVKDSKTIVSAASIGTTIEQGEEVQLPKLFATELGDPTRRIPAAIKIEGPHFALRGHYLTPRATGDFKIDYVVTSVSPEHIIRTYNTSVDNTQSPTLQIIGTMVNYAKLHDTVVLPDAIAIDKNGIYMVPDVSHTLRPYSVEVTDKNGNRPETFEVNAEGKLIFVPTVDGKYTITYKAYNLAQRPIDADVVLYLYAGDITPPDFTLDRTQSATMKQNDMFFFSKITIVSEKDKENLNEIYYKKTLIFPDKTEIVVEGKGETYRLRENRSENSDGHELTLSGTYKVVYEVTDSAGNTSKQEVTISVARTSTNPSAPITAISTILVVLGVLLLIGVAIYVWRFRPIKETTK